MLKETIRAAREKASAGYEEAIDVRAKIEEALREVPPGDKELEKRLLAIEETCTQSVNAAWHAKHVLEALELDLP